MPNGPQNLGCTLGNHALSNNTSRHPTCIGVYRTITINTDSLLPPEACTTPSRSTNCGIVEMQSESAERNAAPQDQPSRADDVLRPFADTSSFVHLPEVLRELVGTVGGLAPWQAVEQNNAPSSLQPASSSHEELDSLLRFAAQRGEQQVALRGYVSSFLRRYNKFAPLRAEILLLRSRAEFEMMVGADQRRFVSESQDRFLHEAAILCDSLPPGVSTSKLLAAHAQVVRDHKRQAERMVRAYDIETQLSKSEYALQQKEFRLAQAASKILELLDQLDLPDQGGSQPSTPASIAVEEATPPLVEYYFDKVGDVGLARDNIIELQLEHREERETRIFQEDQGIVLGVSEDEFEETFSRQLAEAEAALAEAIRRADNAKQVCIDDNLNPELYRNRLRPDLAAISDHSISDEEAQDVPESAPPTATPNGHISPGIRTVGDRDIVQAHPRPPLSTRIRDPVDLILPESLDIADGPSSQRGQDKSGQEDRIKNWIDDVKAGDSMEAEDDTKVDDDMKTEPGDFHAGPLSRSRSSETHSPALVLEQLPDGLWRVNKAASQSKRQQRRESQQNGERYTSVMDDEEERPLLLKRSSSESKVQVLPEWEGSYRDAVDSIRGLATTRE